MGLLVPDGRAIAPDLIFLATKIRENLYCPVKMSRETNLSEKRGPLKFTGKGPSTAGLLQQIHIPTKCTVRAAWLTVEIDENPLNNSGRIGTHLFEIVPKGRPNVPLLLRKPAHALTAATRSSTFPKSTFKVGSLRLCRSKLPLPDYIDAPVEHHDNRTARGWPPSSRRPPHR